MIHNQIRQFEKQKAQSSLQPRLVDVEIGTLCALSFGQILMSRTHNAITELGTRKQTVQTMVFSFKETVFRICG